MHAWAVGAGMFEDAGGEVHEGTKELGEEDEEGAVVEMVEVAEL